MKWMIASDLHGSAYYCKKMLEAYDKEGAQRLLLLGDILYHGPRNDLPRDYAPKEVIAMLNARKADIYNVRGNCDTEVDSSGFQEISLIKIPPRLHIMAHRAIKSMEFLFALVAVVMSFVLLRTVIIILTQKQNCIIIYA